jgi:3-oxoacyl-(acyl-carrier-protein) synthase
MARFLKTGLDTGERQAIDASVRETVAGLDTARLDPTRAAVQMGSALGGMAFAEQQIYNRTERGIRGIDPRVAITTFCGAASCSIAIEFGFSGPNATNAMSCASGAIALGSDGSGNPTQGCNALVGFPAGAIALAMSLRV